MEDEEYRLVLTYQGRNLVGWMVVFYPREGEPQMLDAEEVGPFDTVEEHLRRFCRRVQETIPQSAVRLR